MSSRWNPDNPTAGASSASFSPSPSTYFQATRTPTPSRRNLSSSVFGATGTPRIPIMAAASATRGGTSGVPPYHRGTDGMCETKQTAFEWPVRGVRALKAQLEAGEDPEDADDETRHEALSNDGAYFDDLAYKLHIERSPESNVGSDSREDDGGGDGRNAPADPTLTLMVIALWVKYSDLPPDEMFERTVFIGLKPYEREGARALGEPNWFWSASSLVEFSKRQEYYEVTLPPLSTLLEIPDVDALNAFSIRVVVKHATEPGLPPMVHSDQQFISRRITRQAAGFLDSLRTGDVQFVCLEHAGPGTPDEDGGRKMVRRRVVYAHSELLVHSDYFKSVLKGGFSESQQSSVTTLVVDDAAFNTVYWVLLWLYTDEIIFSTSGSVRAVMAQVRIDKSAARKVLNLESWDYAPLEEEDADNSLEDLRTVCSNSSIGTATSTGRRSPSGRSNTSTTSAPHIPPRRPADSPRSSQIPTHRAAAPRPKSSSPSRATAPGPSIPRPTAGRATTTPGSTGLTVTTGAGPSTGAAGRRKPPALPPKSPTAPTSPAGTRTFPRRSHAPLDPHAHPAERPPPPSPLAVFFLAHRYGLEELQGLARDALLRNLTPETCVAALLATHEFPTLHSAIMDFVSDNWVDVAASTELDRCYQEVSAGVWGEHNGGQVLLGLTRRLTGML